MKATVFSGRNSVQVEEVPDPKILNSRDAIVKISSTAICGSDLHLYDGYVPTVKRGDIFGHEFMGEVTDVGSEVENLKPGDRVVVPFPIACGRCGACRAELYSCCENSNPNAGMAEKLWGQSIAGIFGYSHMLGGFAGGQAEAARVPFADVGPLKLETDLADEQVLFLSDVFPTGWIGAEMCEIQPGDTIAVWGAGPVGQFAIASAKMLGAERVIAIDRLKYRLDMARDKAGATDIVNYEEQPDVVEQVKELTGGRGADACIDAVGLEAHHANLPVHAYDRVRQAARMTTERPHALRECVMACKNGGVVSVVGVYGGFVDKFPMGSLMNRSITMRGAQTHVHRYLRPLLERIERGEIDPSFIVTHQMDLDDAQKGYQTFKHKRDDCMKVVLKP
ncbi:MAG TPA: zinc-dependent alcohol dehydrogenase [Thermoleophilaceae bacterium]